jgi:hypothetical protein
MAHPEEAVTVHLSGATIEALDRFIADEPDQLGVESKKVVHLT